MTEEIGGKRLGSGNKMKVDLRTYNRSTHNLSRVWKSTMAPGTLVPFMVEPILPGDTFDIDLSSLIRTLPTNGPVFGSFKMQLDIFKADMRLYNAQLHNNALGVGMNMEKVLFPLYRVRAFQPDVTLGQLNQQQINQSSLIAYLGTRGLGKASKDYEPSLGEVITWVRTFNAMPLLAYWDIYKNYYANKQEEIGAVINPTTEATAADFRGLDVYSSTGTKINTYLIPAYSNEEEIIPEANMHLNFNRSVIIYGDNLRPDSISLAINVNGMPDWYDGDMQIRNAGMDIEYNAPMYDRVTISVGTSGAPTAQRYLCYLQNESEFTFARQNPNQILDPSTSTGIQVEFFPLSNIDDMRETILQKDKASPLMLGSTGTGVTPVDLPYAAAIGSVENNTGHNRFEYEMAGLGLKTYNSDRFNNWLSTEWIDGVNGISEITKIDTTSGGFTQDALLLAHKVYIMLNRIMVSGGSYDDWVRAVYSEYSTGKPEMPIYVGGMSSEIAFSEVVSTAAATLEDGTEQPLGDLGGRGRETGQKGGTIRVKTDEPAYIIGIISFTPRLDYTQGNKWYTNLETMNDLHKPALDGIGFQELITDEMAAWDTEVDPPTGTVITKSAGKQPAWIHYMTSQNEAYGNFANNNQEAFMIFGRRYEPDGLGDIKDLTTYIDPTKFNHIFAVNELKAQNFWVQIGIDCVARRKMSAKIIPNL